MKTNEMRRREQSVRGSFNPHRAAGPMPHYSAGRNLYPQRYVIGWEDGIVKVGETWHGRRRWGAFLNRGGTMLDLAYYEYLGDALDGEIWLQSQLHKAYPMAFDDKSEAIPYMGPSGGGYLECFKIPPEEWPALIEIARTVDALV